MHAQLIIRCAPGRLTIGSLGIHGIVTPITVFVLLGECSALWGEHEQGSVMGVCLLQPQIKLHVTGLHSLHFLTLSAGHVHTGV